MGNVLTFDEFVNEHFSDSDNLELLNDSQPESTIELSEKIDLRSIDRDVSKTTLKKTLTEKLKKSAPSLGHDPDFIEQLANSFSDNED